jgi:hypothetical protein
MGDDNKHTINISNEWDSTLNKSPEDINIQSEDSNRISPNVKKKSKKWKRSDKINLFGLMVNSFMTLITLIAVLIAYRSLDLTRKSVIDSNKTSEQNLKIARKSVEAAMASANAQEKSNQIMDETFTEQKTMNNNAFILQKKIFDETIKENSRRYNEEKYNLSMQLSNLENQKKTFNSLNESILEVQIDSLLKNEDNLPYIKYRLRNIKNNPAKILNLFSIICLEDCPSAKILWPNYLVYEWLNTNITNGTDLTFKCYTFYDKKIDLDSFAIWNTKYPFILIAGKVLYEDQVTELHKFYHFEIACFFDGDGKCINQIFFENENKEG